MKGIMTVVLAAVVLQGCGNEAAGAREAVKAKLKDPGSAEFRNEKQVRHGVFCGEVNGKNSLGGYSGFQPFIVVDRGEAGLDAIVGDVPSGLIEDACAVETPPRDAVAFAPIPADPVSGAEQWMVRISISHQSNPALVERLKSLNYPIFTTEKDGVLRVFLGPWSSKSDADAQLAMIRIESGAKGFVARFKAAGP